MLVHCIKKQFQNLNKHFKLKTIEFQRGEIHLKVYHIETIPGEA